MVRTSFWGHMTKTTGLAFCICMSVLLVACKPSNSDTDKTAESTSIILGSEDILELGTGEHGTGPIISGSLQPELRADLRAEVSAVIVRVHKENGEPVRKGDILVTLDNSVFKDNLNSAEESLRAAAQSLEGAERQYQRMKSLQAQGMISTQGLEDSENKRNSAQSEYVASKARLAAAKQQLDRTEVRTPFSGVVSARKSSAGDTAQVGKELIQVIDPNSMRFEGQVAADQIGAIKVGQRVNFRINGLVSSAQQLSQIGIVKRIDGAANPITRQVSVIVDLNGNNRPSIVGLYAEGIIETNTKMAILVSEKALRKEGDKVFAWILNENQINKKPIEIDGRDTRTGSWVVKAGLTTGEKIPREDRSTLKNGLAYKLRTESPAKVGQ